MKKIDYSKAEPKPQMEAVVTRSKEKEFNMLVRYFCFKKV